MKGSVKSSSMSLPVVCGHLFQFLCLTSLIFQLGHHQLETLNSMPKTKISYNQFALVKFRTTKTIFIEQICDNNNKRRTTTHNYVYKTNLALFMSSNHFRRLYVNVVVVVCGWSYYCGQMLVVKPQIVLVVLGLKVT